jgi:hypothetical protein
MKEESKEMIDQGREMIKEATEEKSEKIKDRGDSWVLWKRGIAKIIRSSLSML